MTEHGDAGLRSLAWRDRVRVAAAIFLWLPSGSGLWRREDSAAGGGVGFRTGPPPRGLSNLGARGAPGENEGQLGKLRQRKAQKHPSDPFPPQGRRREGYLSRDPRRHNLNSSSP